MKLEDLKKLSEKTTPGPWYVETPTGFIRSRTEKRKPNGMVSGTAIVAIGQFNTEIQPDDAFIAAARTMLPRLIAVAEAAMDYQDEINETDASNENYERMRTALASLEADE